MRPHLLLALPLLAGPLAAQHRVPGPGSSVLFSAASVSSTTELADRGEAAGHSSGGVGALIGGATGAGLVILAYSLGGHEPVCNASIPETCWGGDGLDGASVVIGAVGGAVLGFLVERSLRKGGPE